MELYRGSTAEFTRDVNERRLAGKLEARFMEEFRFRPADGEVRSWQASLAAMDDVLRAGALDDHGILIEYQLPLSSRRLDCSTAAAEIIASVESACRSASPNQSVGL